jgi:hypothetical protein
MNACLDWTALDDQAVNTARILAADAVEKVGRAIRAPRSRWLRWRTCCIRR